MFICMCAVLVNARQQHKRNTPAHTHTHTITHLCENVSFDGPQQTKEKKTERHFASSCCSFSSSLPPPATHLPLTYRPSHIPPHFTAVSRTLRLCTCIVASCVCLIGIVIVIVTKSTCGSLSVPRAKAT